MRREIRVQTEPFDVSEEMLRLHGSNASIGAVASFLGLVRGDTQVGAQRENVAAMMLEHYPGMTEKALQRIVDAAAERWSLQAVTVIHRVGELQTGDPIVLVLTACAHRHTAFEACQYIMDILKTTAPFWKKERLPDGAERWVDAKESDADAAAQWLSAS